MITVAALLRVECKNMSTKGVMLGSARSRSREPAQKIIVTQATKASAALMPKAVMREKGIVREASRAFSAEVFVSTRRVRR